MEENAQPIIYNQKFGRTWVDFLTSTGGLILLVIIMSLLLYFGWDYVELIPMWVWPALFLTPIVWTPFLMSRARDDTQLLIVSDGPQMLTEYRVGKRVQLDIEGAVLPFSSRTGTVRNLLTDFDPYTRKGKGSALAEFNQFEMARDLSTLDRLSKAFSEHLRAERVTQELITVEVQKKVKALSERWLGIAMATLEPEELETALNLTEYENEIHTTIDEVIDFE
jgi:hypothetical protein